MWTTLGICWTWSYDAAGNVQLPTREQQRFMVYDAILNGARALAFYGGQNPKCWGSSMPGGWNWTYWERVLEPLVREISAAKPARAGAQERGRRAELPPPTLGPSDLRRGRNGELWVIAVRGGDEGSVDADDRWAPGCSERLRRREPVGADRRWRAGGHLRPLVRSRVPPDGVGGAFQLIVGPVAAPAEAGWPRESVITPSLASRRLTSSASGTSTATKPP